MSKRTASGAQLSRFHQKHMWSEEKLRLAASLAGKEPIQVIAKLVNKTKYAVAKKLGRHGFNWAHPDNEAL